MAFLPQVTTYSFADIFMTFAHPLVGIYTVNGSGIGEVSVSNINDNTAHDNAADGAIMISKIKAANATISITMQQTSAFHKYLMNYFNAVTNAPSAVWAAAEVNISSSLGMGETVSAFFVSPTKPADQPYQTQGQMVTWNFMSGNCTRFAGIGGVIDG